MAPSADDLTYEFHHLGIPTTEPRPNERFSARFGVYTSDADSDFIRVQWHRFTADSSFPSLIQTFPHTAFKVKSLERAIDGRNVLVHPYEPIEGFRVAFVEDHGLPVELIETSLSDDEVWSRAEHRQKAPLITTRRNRALSHALACVPDSRLSLQ